MDRQKAAKPFLRTVAEHYVDEGFGNRIFVFPNRRSMVFFKKHVCDILKDRGRGAVLSPAMMGMNEFISALSARKASDRISLLLSLYNCYSRLMKEPEPLDSFIYWGDTLIADFNDVDKYMVDASQLFTNIVDLKAIDSDLSYLEQKQRDALEKLSEHFSASRWDRSRERRLDVKKQFLGLWSILGRLYADFHTELEGSGRAYEGMICRNLAETMKSRGAADVLHSLDPSLEGCVFIGLNTLNPCEEKILSAFRDAGLASFHWNRPRIIENDTANRANRFMADNFRNFPDRLRYDDPSAFPEVNIVSVPSATGQAKVLNSVISGIPENERGLDMAVVLPDETMLTPVLTSLPADTGCVNITMGYPLASSEWNSMMRSICALQMHCNGKTFYHRQVADIFSCAILKGVMGDEGAALADSIRREAKAYVPAGDLQGAGRLTDLIFRPVVKKQNADPATIAELSSYLCEVVEAVAHGLDPKTDTLHMECAYRYLQCVRRLEGTKLEIQPRTFFHLLDQLIAGVSVPFSGEPLGGMQIMGPLETRALDFKHLVIFNANEGVFPGRSTRASYIPVELRRAFDLPTYENQDSLWAYYFYSMISRAQDVWMIYDSRTEGLATGEESRFIKQLKHLYPHRCHLNTFSASCDMGSSRPLSIPKTAEDIEVMRKATFSASSIHKWISCQAQFYYYTVKNLHAQDEVTEDLDKSMLGTICHDTLQAIYCCEEAMDPAYDFDKTKGDDGIRSRTVGRVTEDFIRSWLKRDADLRRKIEALVCRKLHCPEVGGRNLVAVDVALRYVRGVLEADLQLIRDKGPFKILGLEKKYCLSIQGHRFVGYIDRMDSFMDGTVRIVDYKTGKDSQEDLDSSAGADAVVKDIFDRGGRKAAFQFYVYDTLVRESGEYDGMAITNSLYSMTEVFSKQVKTYGTDEGAMAAIEERLAEAFAEMEDPDKDFAMTSNTRNCRNCDYMTICGRTKKD